MSQLRHLSVSAETLKSGSIETLGVSVETLGVSVETLGVSVETPGVSVETLGVSFDIWLQLALQLWRRLCLHRYIKWSQLRHLSDVGVT